MGVGYKGGAPTHHSISENIQRVKDKGFILQHGYFGEKGNSKSNDIRHIKSDNPQKTAKDFYDAIAYGAKEESDSSGNLVISKMSDGTVITYRKTSSSDGTPAVDINVYQNVGNGELKPQKIHFIYEEEKK